MSNHRFSFGLSVPHQPFTLLFTLSRSSLVLWFSKFGGQRGPPRGRFGVGPDWDESKVRPRGSPTIPRSPTVLFWIVPPGSVTATVSDCPSPLGLLVRRQLFDRLFTLFRPSLVFRFSEVGDQRGSSSGRFGVGLGWAHRKPHPTEVQ